jgi:hypothetical protein
MKSTANLQTRMRRILAALPSHPLLPGVATLAAPRELTS